MERQASAEVGALEDIFNVLATFTSYWNHSKNFDTFFHEHKSTTEFPYFLILEAGRLLVSISICQSENLVKSNA